MMMRLLLSTIASRGDVQPLVALALRLKSLGQEVHLYVPPDFQDWIESLGMPVTPIGPELRLPGLKQPERLPQYLTDKQVRLLRDHFESRLARALHPYQRRDALLDLAFFYLLWQCGTRKGEVEELRLEDLDLSNRRLSVRNGKGMKDRTIYLTGTAVHALHAYLAVRGAAPTDHVFLYRNQALKKDLARSRIKDAGKR